jgi:hypothetical protein
LSGCRRRSARRRLFLLTSDPSKQTMYCKPHQHHRTTVFGGCRYGPYLHLQEACCCVSVCSLENKPSPSFSGARSMVMHYSLTFHATLHPSSPTPPKQFLFGLFLIALFSFSFSNLYFFYSLSYHFHIAFPFGSKKPFGAKKSNRRHWQQRLTITSSSWFAEPSTAR